MAPQAVTITLQSSIGEEGPLKVQDSLRQVIDFFELLSMAGESQEEKSIGWILHTISKTSPLTATGEPVALRPDVSADVVASHAKEALAQAFVALSRGNDAPPWMAHHARERAREFLYRNMNGLGRTDIQFDEDAPVVSINERTARTAVAVLDRAELQVAVLEADLSRSEYGSVEGQIVEATTYHGRPAIRFQEHLTDAFVMCVFSQELGDRIGEQHNWVEIWSGQRVLVAGQLFYRKDGAVNRIHAADMQTVRPDPISVRDIADPGFTNGLSPVEHISRLWDGDDG